MSFHHCFFVLFHPFNNVGSVCCIHFKFSIISRVRGWFVFMTDYLLQCLAVLNCKLPPAFPLHHCPLRGSPMHPRSWYNQELSCGEELVCIWQVPWGFHWYSIIPGLIWISFLGISHHVIIVILVFTPCCRILVLAPSFTKSLGTEKPLGSFLGYLVEIFFLASPNNFRKAIL
jgi:hypothetical protein